MMAQPKPPVDPESADARDFRDAMATLAATVCVVTAREGDRCLGRTVTAALSLGVAPPTILVSISATSELARVIHATGGFSFAMLSEGLDDVADAFAGKLPPDQRFFDGDWLDWPSGHPRLVDSVASMDCTVTGQFEAEGHQLFIGQVRDIIRTPRRKPLLWYKRNYGSVSAL